MCFQGCQVDDDCDDGYVCSGILCLLDTKDLTIPCPPPDPEPEFPEFTPPTSEDTDPSPPGLAPVLDAYRAVRPERFAARTDPNPPPHPRLTFPTRLT